MGTLPPLVEINSLSGRSRLPSLVELKEVLNMQYLVRCIEHMYFYSKVVSDVAEWSWNLLQSETRTHYPSENRRFLYGLGGNNGATIDSFRKRFYRAMYRLLLAGAVLARAYLAPSFQAEEEGRKGFLWRFSLEAWRFKHLEEVDSSEEGPLRPEDLAYLRQFPVYNYDVTDWSEIGQWRNQEYEACFGPFASWIIEDGRKRQLEDDFEHSQPDWAEARADVGAVRELMLLMVAYDYFCNNFVNTSRRDVHRAARLRRQGDRAVSIVRFGVFQVEEITMPAEIQDLTEGFLDAKFHPALKDSKGENIPIRFDVDSAFEGLRWKERYNPAIPRENLVAPPRLEFWHFALRHYLNLGFKAGTFREPRRSRDAHNTWRDEVGRGIIFINPNWAVVQKYEPGVVSWVYNGGQQPPLGGQQPPRRNNPFSRLLHFLHI